MYKRNVFVAHPTQPLQYAGAATECSILDAFVAVVMVVVLDALVITINNKATVVIKNLFMIKYLCLFLLT